MSILAIGIAIGRVTIDDQQSHAQDRQQDRAEQRTFLSGGARSERVLTEMNETLKRIEARLETMEGIMKEQQVD